MTTDAKAASDIYVDWLGTILYQNSAGGTTCITPAGQKYATGITIGDTGAIVPFPKSEVGGFLYIQKTNEDHGFYEYHINGSGQETSTLLAVPDGVNVNIPQGDFAVAVNNKLTLFLDGPPQNYTDVKYMFIVSSPTTNNSASIKVINDFLLWTNGRHAVGNQLCFLAEYGDYLGGNFNNTICTMDLDSETINTIYQIPNNRTCHGLVNTGDVVLFWLWDGPPDYEGYLCEIRNGVYSEKRTYGTVYFPVPFAMTR